MPFLFPTKIRHSSVQSLLSVFFFGVKFQEVRGDHAFYAELWHYSISSIHFVRNMKTDSNSKKPKKGSICEEDIATLLRRYPATAVLSLLQEVAILPESKIDWNALVKKTNTGISDAKECQMLWRHLAYSDALLDRPEDGAELLDDDSDLEFELEAYPTVNSDVAADIAACVKVLITSDLPSSAIIGHNLTVESLLTINATNGQSSRSASENKQTFTVPVSVDKHQSFVASAEGLDETGNMPPRKRRKAWSKAEDLELEAAVEKFGEGNWANIVKVNFKGDRTASQLSQRWAIIRKRKNLTVEITKSSGSQLSETQVIAARHAMSLALDMPSRKPGIGSKLSQNQSHQATVPGKPSPSEPTSTQNTIGLIKRSPPNASLDTDLGIKAAAVAAGARIATVKDAASLLIASQAKKAVHIIPSGRSQIKCSVPGPSSLRPGTFHLSSGSSSQAASTSSSTVKIAPPAKADTAAASDARVREQTTTDLPLEQEPIVKVVEAKAAYEPSNAPQSREHGASASAESTSETIQKESEMIDGKSNIEGDATNSGQKYCLSH